MKARFHSIALVVVWLMIFAYGVYFSGLSIQHHRAFLTNASDLGQFDQAIWNTLHGRPLEFTRRTGEQSIRLTDHVEPIFLPVSLVFLAYDNVEALLILQSFALAIGALAVFWIGREKLAAQQEGDWKSPSEKGASPMRDSGERWQIEGAGVLFAAMYLLFPALEAATLAEFHAVTFVPALVLFAYHYGWKKKWGRFALLAFLLLMVKEEIALLVFMLAAYFVFSDFGVWISDFKNLPSRLFAYLKHAPRVPLFFTVFSLFWFALTVFVIIPQANALGRSPYTCRYVVSEDCPEVVRGLFPEQRLGYLFQLFASSGFVSILDPVSLVLGSPLILANVVSNYPAQYSGTFHYSAPLVPYFVLAAIGGSAFLSKKIRARNLQSALSRSILTVVIPVFLIAFAYHRYAGYTPVARAYSFPEITARNQLFERFAAQIPRDARVATTPSLHPHLSHRQFLYRYPVVNDAEYVLLDVSESDRGIPVEFRVRYNELLQQGFGVVDAADGYVLLKRGAPNKQLPNEFFTLFRAPNVTPQYPAQVDFEDKVRFLGYDIVADAHGRSYLRTYWQRLQALDANFFLFPFVADEDGNPIPDLNYAMTSLFWYPSASWQDGETIVAQTVPLDWGDRIKLGVGVAYGADWSADSQRLHVSGVVPLPLPVRDGVWVDLGTFARAGEGYVRE